MLKSPLLTTVNVTRKQLKVALNKILDDLNANIEDFQTQSGQKTNRKRIRKVNKFTENIDLKEKNVMKINLIQVAGHKNYLAIS